MTQNNKKRNPILMVRPVVNSKVVPISDSEHWDTPLSIGLNVVSCAGIDFKEQSFWVNYSDYKMGEEIVPPPPPAKDLEISLNIKLSDSHWTTITLPLIAFNEDDINKLVQIDGFISDWKQLVRRYSHTNQYKITIDELEKSFTSENKLLIELSDNSMPSDIDIWDNVI